MRASKIGDREIHILSGNGMVIAGININYYRPWIYPLCSPSGINILREFPPDHGFHNGFFFGHNPVVCKEKKFNFWGAPPFRSKDDELQENLGRITAQIKDVAESRDRVDVLLIAEWGSIDGTTILLEHRYLSVQIAQAVSTIETESVLTNVTDDVVTLLQSKFSGHTLRLNNQIDIAKIAALPNYLCSMNAKTITGLEIDLIGYQVCGIGYELEFYLEKSAHFLSRNYGFLSANPFFNQSKSLKPGEKTVIYTKINLT
jgi:hypothetical protein